MPEHTTAGYIRDKISPYWTPSANKTED